MTLLIRGYQPADAQALTDIFYDSIHTAGLQYYSKAQVAAWAPLPKDYAGWRTRLDNKPPFVAEHNGVLVGFITLEADGHIDWTYTHPDYQRQGVAGALYAYLEQQALAMGIQRLYVEASHLARPFFAKQGFLVTCKNQVQRKGEVLINWSMEKRLLSKA